MQNRSQRKAFNKTSSFTGCNCAGGCGCHSGTMVGPTGAFHTSEENNAFLGGGLLLGSICLPGKAGDNCRAQRAERQEYKAEKREINLEKQRNDNKLANTVQDILGIFTGGGGSASPSPGGGGGNPEPEKDNTMLYVGIAIGAVVLIGLAVFLIKRKK